MLEHTKRQVHKWKFSQHALFPYVYNRSLFDIFTQVEMAEEYEFLRKKTFENSKSILLLMKSTCLCFKMAWIEKMRFLS